MTKSITTLMFIATFAFNANAQRETPSAYQFQNSGSIHISTSNGGDILSSPNQSGLKTYDGTAKSIIYSSALWLGGQDNNGNLHLSVATYRQSGFDYFPGPISNDSVASSKKYNQIYHITQNDIDQHIANPGSINAINNWPGNGDVNNGEDQIIAPFFDKNQNQIYEPNSGDYPLIRGNESSFSIFNDAGLHTESKALPLNVEVKTLVTNYNSNGFLDSAVFVHFSVTNKSQINYNNFYFSLFTDFEIGNYTDDFVGCDPKRNMFFGYNGKATDEGADGFGKNAPAVGVLFLNKPLTTFKQYENSASPVDGYPRTASNYYNLMQGRFNDSSEVKDLTGSPSKLEFSGDVSNNKEWNAYSAGKVPGEHKGVGSHGPFTFQSGETICYDVAYFYGRGRDHLDAVKIIQRMADSIQNQYDKGMLTNNFSLCDKVFGSTQTTKIAKLKIYPNPTENILNFDADLKFGKDVTINIFDQLGKLVYTESSQNEETYQVDLSSLSSGIYTVTVISGEVLYQTKLVKK